jgi:hypothetical protein
MMFVRGEKSSLQHWVGGFGKPLRAAIEKRFRIDITGCSLPGLFGTALYALLASACSGAGPAVIAATASASAQPSTAQSSTAQPATAPLRSSMASLNNRLIMGYQGWFGCPGDFDGNTQWVHWFTGEPAADHLLVDMLPATDGLAPDDLCDTGLITQNGAPLRLFSSQNANVVDWHFQLMAQQGVGAVALERFVIQLNDDVQKRRVDNVLRNVIQAAEDTGVPFFISYDVSGADPATVVQTIRQDWRYLAAQFGLTSSKAYLQDNGKPVLELWGFGFVENPGAADEVQLLSADLKAGNDGLQSVTLVGGIPSDWRTLQGDSKTDSAWMSVYLGYDVLSPWMVGRFDSESAASRYYDQTIAPDRALAQSMGLRYLPVIFPGFSRYNLMLSLGDPSQAIVNQIPRNCGNFIWQQSYLLLSHGVDMAYGAMFDELDEGTAVLPAESAKAGFPVDAQGVYLDEDGCTLPSDWYVTVMGRIASNFTAGTVPSLPLR